VFDLVPLLIRRQFLLAGISQGWNVYLRRPTTAIKCPVVDSPIPKPNSSPQEFPSDRRITGRRLNNLA